MSINIMNEKLTIKDLIFTKALPNYKIPVPTDGYKIFSCTDCGDKFLFESSYEHHINRKSLKITYFCRHCMIAIVFYNRCNLLSHIRSHAFKSATITVSDLKIEPLPLEHFNLSILQKTKQQPDNLANCKKKSVCYECSENIYKYGVIYKDRAAHYMEKTTEAHVCPICTFVFPTICGLEAHLRIHLNIPPFFCSECGMHLPNRVASYPFDHDCEGFKMMKSATRLTCNIDGCEKFFHPDEYRTHFKTHLKKVYRCSYCLEMWCAEKKTQCTLCKRGNIYNYIQCPRCPKKLFAESLIERHINPHCSHLRDKLNVQSYPCTVCDLVFKQMNNLINHHVNIHSSANLKTFLSKFSFKEANKQPKFRKHVYHRVIKKCSKCLRSFTYRCVYENIKKLPIDCPFRCSSNTDTQSTSQTNETRDSLEIVCPLCKRKVNQSWTNIKTHYAEFHKNHKCLDIQVLLHPVDRKLLSKKMSNRKTRRAMINNKLKRNKLQVSKITVKKEAGTTDDIQTDSKTNANVCAICRYNCENRQNLETHIITHRDPCMAYQCLECGKSFVVKPSFSTHLLLEHGISDVQAYIAKKPCYNELALLKDQNALNPPVDEPVKENQCRICREQFETSNDLEKHFRVHGMAFLLKNAQKNSISP